MKIFKEAVLAVHEGFDFLPREFSEGLKNARIFITAPGLWRETANTRSYNYDYAVLEEVVKETIPFPSVWIEDEEADVLGSIYSPEGVKVATTHGILLIEKEPGKVIGYAYGYPLDNPTGNLIKVNSLIGTCTEIFCQVLLELLEKGDVGFESPDAFIKAPHPLGVGYRNFREVGQITRIVSTNHKEYTRPLFSKPINWSYSWEVRGHWMRCKGIGKNRQGEYVVPGMTWRTAYTKGEGVLIQKTRKIDKRVSSSFTD